MEQHLARSRAQVKYLAKITKETFLCQGETSVVSLSQLSFAVALF